MYDTKKQDRYGNPVYSTKDKFKVTNYKVVDGKIVGLAIENETKKKRAFLMLPPETKEQKKDE